jgi:hypothetical protein
VFPGSVLIEATEISEGRGTTRPFELIGSPGLPGAELARAMNDRGIPGVVYLPVRFRPQFQKHARTICDGVEIVVTDAAAFTSYRAGIELVRAIHQLAPAALEWRRAPYEFVSDRHAIDLLTGGDEFRTRLEGGGDVDGWIASWRADEDEFIAESAAVLLYGERHPAPVSPWASAARCCECDDSAALRTLFAAIAEQGARLVEPMRRRRRRPPRPTVPRGRRGVEGGERRAAAQRRGQESARRAEGSPARALRGCRGAEGSAAAVASTRRPREPLGPSGEVRRLTTVELSRPARAAASDLSRIPLYDALLAPVRARGHPNPRGRIPHRDLWTSSKPGRRAAAGRPAPKWSSWKIASSRPT